MASDAHFDPRDLPEFPPTDESGDVDLSLVEYCLSLTPAERLLQAEQFAQSIITIRSANGLPWLDFERS